MRMAARENRATEQIGSTRTNLTMELGPTHLQQPPKLLFLSFQPLSKMLCICAITMASIGAKCSLFSNSSPWLLDAAQRRFLSLKIPTTGTSLTTLHPFRSAAVTQPPPVRISNHPSLSGVGDLSALQLADLLMFLFSEHSSILFHKAGVISSAAAQDASKSKWKS